MRTRNVEDVRNEFIRNLDAKKFVIDKSGVKTFEIVKDNFLADEDSIL